MSDVEIDYDYLTQQALKQVVRDVLKMTEELGAAPGDHHFYIEFDTQAEGVAIPGHLLAQYPQRMTIVLQHQFNALEVHDDAFSVTLWFKNVQSRLTVPFEAVTSFADPSVQFGLRFEGAVPTRAPVAATPITPAVAAKVERAAAASEGAAVVSLDAFRKK
ncbi:MAG: ClpXP protease specificity-enhancing factor SspB [Parvularculaceae bacterium]|nr:ClpXP protease specificity-enhancing factor SspB [Parvularculaceae bacterium]